MPIAIYLTNHDDRKQLIEQLRNGALVVDNLTIVGKTVAVFSKLTLLHFLQEEYRHERFDLTGSAEKPLSLMSEGEQKKALLAALLKKKPDVLIVDDVFDSLDQASQQALAQQLQQLAGTFSLIQLLSRYRDKLPFIDQIYQVRDGALQAYQHAATPLEDGSQIAVPEPFEVSVPFANPLVRMRNLCVEYDGRCILNNINWDINNGEFWQLKGANGSGKSSLLRLISGDSPKGFGQQLYLFGRKKGSGESVWDIKKQIGYFTGSMVQHFSRYETVENMLVSGFFDSVGLYQQPHKRHYQLARQWLALIGLDDQAAKPFSGLAPGHQRLLLAARAMVKHPPLLILDEPTAGLDDADAGRLIRLVNTVAASRQSAMIYVSHREEAGLQPQYVMELLAGDAGSTARIVKKTQE